MRFQPGFWSALSPFQFVASGAASGTTITIPTDGRVAGYVACIANVAYTSSLSIPSAVTPSGFTILENDSDSSSAPTAFGVRGILSAKILTGSETTLTGMNGTAAKRSIVAVFKPRVPVSGFSWAGNGQATTSNPSAQTIAASGQTPPVLCIGQMYASGIISSQSVSGMTEIVGSVSAHLFHHLVYPAGSTPANLTYDMGDEGFFNILQSGRLTFTFT